MTKGKRYIAVLLLGAVVLCAACGKEAEVPSADDGADIRYEDYIDPVVDRKVTDCITVQQISAEVGYAMRLAGVNGDSVARYESEDAYCQVTLTMENRTRAEFDAIAANPDLSWELQQGVGEIAYWNQDKTELIVYRDGYAVSVAAYHAEPFAMQRIAQLLLEGL